MSKKTILNKDPPRIDMNSTHLELLHDILQWEEAGSNVLGLVGKGLEEPGGIVFTIEAHDEGFEREGGDSWCAINIRPVVRKWERTHTFPRARRGGR
jgi:hypothetical protein